MKKFKIFITAIVCCICLCFGITGCTGSGAYVNNSLKYKGSSDSDYWYKINYSFEIIVNGDGDFDVDYVFTYTTKNGREVNKSFTSSFVDCKKGDTKVVSGDFSISNSNYDADSEISLLITKIYPANYDDKSVDYAIGFGVAGGLILCGAIALFVVLKAKKKI